jgi:hypothetical protein
MFYVHVTVWAQALARVLDDATKYCMEGTLPQVFDEIVCEIESTKAVAARDTNAVMDCLETMSTKVTESFFQDKPLCV